MKSKEKYCQNTRQKPERPGQTDLVSYLVKEEGGSTARKAADTNSKDLVVKR